MSETVISSGQTVVGLVLPEVVSGSTITTAVIDPGGNLTSGTIDANGTVVDAGVAYDTTVNAGGIELITTSAYDYNSIIAGGTVVNSGGVGYGATIDNGGIALAEAGGAYVSLTVASDGEELLLSGGLDVGDVISGGLQFVGAGAAAASVTVEAGGTQTVSGLTSASTARDGGVITIAGGGTADAATIGTNGAVLATGVANNATLAGGLLDILSGGAATGTVTFNGVGDLVLGMTPTGTALTGATINGFGVGDVIDAAQLAYDQTGRATLVAGNTLDIIADGETNTVAFDPTQSFAGDGFYLVPDRSGGTGVVVAALPCFVAGARIATPSGSIAVETLWEGDLVTTASGDTRRVIWTGARRVDCDHAPEPEMVRPIRVRAGAFAESVPARDLLLSPDHAVFADGVLIPVRCLVNGASVVQESTRHVSYHHVELERHDLLLAEGLAVESYLDTGHRAALGDGRGGVVTLRPDFASGREASAGCAPLVTDEARVRPIWERLARRATVSGDPTGEQGRAAA